MILKIDNTHPDFYNIMGRHFANRRFIKEMDCQLYDDGFVWYLSFLNHELCGFASVEQRKKNNYLDNLYVFEDFRNCGIGSEIVKSVLEDHSNVVLISKNPYAIRIFEQNGFKECGGRGQYKRFRYEKLC